MPKFVVIELNDEASTIDLLSYCVKKNFDRISILNRLEDHPYLRDDQDVVVQDEAQPEDGMLLQLNDEERQRLVKMISNPGPQTLNIQMPSGQNQHLLQQHPSTSAYNVTSSFIYIKSDGQYKESSPPSTDQFEETVNSVAHGGAGLTSLEMFSCNGSPSSDVLRRKTPNRKAEDSMKATCKLCRHEVMYSPQRTWNLMRHVWIMHPSTKPNQCSICGYAHIKPYVRKHIDSQHKHETGATIIDLKSPELELEWSALLERCFGVTYRKWKHHKEDPSQHPAFAADEELDHFSPKRHYSPDEDVMTNL